MEEKTILTENTTETETKEDKNVVITSESVERNEMQQTALMEKLKKLQKKQLRYSQASALFILILVIALLSVLPSVFKTLSAAQETMSNMNTVLTNANDTILKSQTTLDEVSELVTTTQTELIDTTNKLSSIDFEGLNSAINDLEAVVAPLADLFKY